MCERCNSRELNPAWDSLLTDEEKELLKEVRCSVDLQTLNPQDVKIIVKHVKEMCQVKENEG